MSARRLGLWCPDWPVVAAVRAAGADPFRASAVLSAHRVVACSAAARACGVRRGMRQRTAQQRCAELLVLDADEDREARLFEDVVRAVEAVAPGVEVVRPGLVAVPAAGPAHYFGGESAAAERLVDEVEARVDVECQVGIADTLFAAVLAARRGVVVPAGGDAAFLEPLPVADLDQLTPRQEADEQTWVELLPRLGVRTLGAFAALAESEVAGRFGAAAVLAHRAARGEQERPPERREPGVALGVEERFEEPLHRIDEAAFAVKSLADRMHAGLVSRGLACTRLGIRARTERGERMSRVWRCAEPLTAQGTADRVRWQLDGWLSGRGAVGTPTAGIAALQLRPDELVDAGSLQLDLFDSAEGGARDRAERAFSRVSGLLGADEVLTGVLGGGRDVRDRVRWVPWGERRAPALPARAPWPGRIPPPEPSVVPDEPWPVSVLDAAEQPVRVDERRWLSASPHRVVFARRDRRVLRWAGPWPLEERWWAGLVGDAVAAPERGGVRVQVVLAPQESADPAAARADPREAGAVRGEEALLLSERDAQWWVVGVYR